MLEFEETEGFVNFPPAASVNVLASKNKTLVYLVAFDWTNVTGGSSILSNLNLKINADFISDDVNGIQARSNSTQTKSTYLKNGNSVPLVTSICLGWNENSFKIKQDGSDLTQDWFCTFRDLTNEGRKLYYSIKKLHNNKEVRILTFNSVRKNK